MAKFEIKQNATKPFLQAELQDGEGNAIDLTTGSYIYFQMSTNDNQYTPVFSGAAQIRTGTGSTEGKVQYNWAASDTGSIGNYLAEFAVTFNDGYKLVLPADHGLFVKIYEDYS